MNNPIPSQEATAAVHDAISRALDEAGITNEVLRGMCIEVGLDKFNDSFLPPTVPSVEGWWVLEFGSIAVVEGEPGRIVSRELFPSREAADRAADDCEFSSRVIPLSDLLAACFAGGSPAGDVEAPAAINQDSVRLDWLEIMANKKGGLLLHDGSERNRVGLGLRPGNLVRTLREAIDTSCGLKLTKSSAAAPTGADGGLIEGEGV
jgi:hypothetical protein